MDRESLEPLELLDAIERDLALDTTPIVWPVGMGRDFKGTFDLATGRLRRLGSDDSELMLSGPDDARLAEIVDADLLSKWREEIELVRTAARPFDLASFREGHLTPVFFGSALRNFGVRDLLDALVAYAPPPRAQQADRRLVEATEPGMTGVVFKIQANMDPNHRDRIAFLRLCSGKLTKGMKARLVRTGKPIALNAPQFFFAQDRSIATEAVAGDVVGIPNHGTLRIGDTLTEGEELSFTGVPNFAPEILRRVRVADAMKGKQLRTALAQMAEEGVVQIFSPLDGTGLIVGVVGALQLDVLIARMAAEYGLETALDPAGVEVARWVQADKPADLDAFLAKYRGSIAEDVDGDPVYLARSQFDLEWTRERNAEIRFVDIKETQRRGASR
jgi:peptide chain release factor 3